MASKIVSTASGLVGKKKTKRQQQQQNKKPLQSPLQSKEPIETDDKINTTEVKPVDANPVGRLQELSQHRLWPLPSYAFECSNGDNPSKRQFTCTVQLRSHTARGVGRSKQLAKRASALAMLQQLVGCTENCCQSVGDLKNKTTLATTPDKKKETPPPSPLDEAAFQELRSSKRLQSAARAGAEVGGLFCGVRNRKAGSSLPPLETPISTASSSSASDQLMDLSKQHRFGVQFLQNSSGPEVSSNGQHRVVVKLSTMPTIVAVGNGVNAAAAREQACRAAMEYLCSLTRESAPAGKKA